MRITRKPGEIFPDEARRIEANAGCDVCPCCGEDRKYADAPLTDHSGRGIMHMGESWKDFGFFHGGLKTIDHYKCYTCGAEWESDPY